MRFWCCRTCKNVWFDRATLEKSRNNQIKKECSRRNVWLDHATLEKTDMVPRNNERKKECSPPKSWRDRLFTIAMLKKSSLRQSEKEILFTTEMLKGEYSVHRNNHKSKNVRHNDQKRQIAQQKNRRTNDSSPKTKMQFADGRKYIKFHTCMSAKFHILTQNLSA